MREWHILVIEDDKDGQEVICRMLKYHRITYDVASTGEEALKLLAQKPFTACIIDLALPGLDGWGVLKHVRNSDLKDMPCVAVTAFHSSEVAVKAIEAEFTAYFSKPLDTTSFVRELTHVLTTHDL